MSLVEIPLFRGAHTLRGRVFLVFARLEPLDGRRLGGSDVSVLSPSEVGLRHGAFQFLWLSRRVVKVRRLARHESLVRRSE